MFSIQRGKILIRLILRNQLKSKRISRRYPDYDECFDKLMNILERRERRFHFAKSEFPLSELIPLCKKNGFVIYPNHTLYLCGNYCINGGAKRAIKFIKLFLEMEELLRNIEESDNQDACPHISATVLS